MFDRLDDLVRRYEELMLELNDPSIANDQARFRKLMKEQADLAPIVEAYKEYKKCKETVQDSLAILDEESDEEMKELAKEELNEAKARIEELENENAELREELEYYKNRKLSGRQKHNAKWMAIYNDFVAGYESGMTMVEIAKRNNVSERTIYRYKAYYDKMRKVEVDE